jgi:catechol 2,3-dioxygenase-like lactoylglutathione lyase family enzyme
MHSLAINHLALNCQDVAAQEALFAKHFGFQRSRTFNAGKPNEFIVLKLGSVRLELFPADSAKTGHQKGGEQAIGFKHLAFDVPRLEPAIEALRADGIEREPIIDMSELIPRFSDRLLLRSRRQYHRSDGRLSRRVVESGAFLLKSA